MLMTGDVDSKHSTIFLASQLAALDYLLLYVLTVSILLSNALNELGYLILAARVSATWVPTPMGTASLLNTSVKG